MSSETPPPQYNIPADYRHRFCARYSIVGNYLRRIISDKARASFFPRRSHIPEVIRPRLDRVLEITRDSGVSRTTDSPPELRGFPVRLLSGFHKFFDPTFH